LSLIRQRRGGENQKICSSIDVQVTMNMKSDRFKFSTQLSRSVKDWVRINLDSWVRILGLTSAKVFMRLSSDPGVYPRSGSDHFLSSRSTDLI
jgi:hypothetical protein